MTFRVGKAQTISGRPVTIFTTTARGPYPIVGVVHNTSQDDEASWTETGRFKNFGKSCSTDLIGSVEAKAECDMDVK